MRGMLELAGTRDALQDVLVGDDAVSDQLNRRARQVSQVVVQDGLFRLLGSAHGTGTAREMQPAYAIVLASDGTVTVLDCRRIESAGECPLTGRSQIDVLEDDNAMFVKELFDSGWRKRARGFGSGLQTGKLRERKRTHT